MERAKELIGVFAVVDFYYGSVKGIIEFSSEFNSFSVEILGNERLRFSEYDISCVDEIEGVFHIELK